MNLVTFLDRAGIAEGVETPTIERVDGLLAEGATFAEVAAKKELGLPVRTLLDIAEGRLRFENWMALSAPLRTTVPDELLDTAVARHQLSTPQQLTQHTPPDKWSTGLELWNRAFALALREGTVRVDGTPGLGFDEYLTRREALEDIAPHRWPRVRRGERVQARVMR